MRYTKEWFHRNADAAPRQCRFCGNTFTIRNDYPWDYFPHKKYVLRGAVFDGCPKCHADEVLRINRDKLLFCVSQKVSDSDRALFRLLERDLDRELKALILPAPQRTPAM